MSATMYRWLADLVVVIHAAFVLFVIGAQAAILIGWAARWEWVRNPWFRFGHLLAIGIVVVQSWLGIWCPLTTLEEWLRNRAGESRYGDDMPGFIGYWAHELIFFRGEPWVFTLCYSLFGALVLITLIFAPPRLGRRIETRAISAAPTSSPADKAAG